MTATYTIEVDQPVAEQLSRSAEARGTSVECLLAAAAHQFADELRYNDELPPLTPEEVADVKAAISDAQERTPHEAVMADARARVGWDGVADPLSAEQIRSIMAGLADVAAGRTFSHEEVFAEVRAKYRRA